MKKSMLFFVLCFASCILYAQNRRIKFEVTDIKNKPLLEANIVNEYDKYLVSTDSTGIAWLNWDENYTIKTFFNIKCEGYQTKAGIRLNPDYDHRVDTITIKIQLLKYN